MLRGGCGAPGARTGAGRGPGAGGRSKPATSGPRGASSSLSSGSASATRGQSWRQVLRLGRNLPLPLAGATAVTRPRLPRAWSWVRLECTGSTAARGPRGPLFWTRPLRPWPWSSAAGGGLTGSFLPGGDAGALVQRLACVQTLSRRPTVPEQGSPRVHMGLVVPDIPGKEPGPEGQRSSWPGCSGIAIVWSQNGEWSLAGQATWVEFLLPSRLRAQHGEADL